MREVVRVALNRIASRFSDDAPSIDTRVLRSRYRVYEAWPADAQLALGVLAWVLGPGFHLPRFAAAVNAPLPDFRRAAAAVGRGGANSTLVTLGGITRRGLRNGDVVLQWNLDPDTLYWPHDLSSCIGATFWEGVTPWASSTRSNATSVSSSRPR